MALSCLSLGEVRPRVVYKVERLMVLPSTVPSLSIRVHRFRLTASPISQDLALTFSSAALFGPLGLDPCKSVELSHQGTFVLLLGKKCVLLTVEHRRMTSRTSESIHVFPPCANFVCRMSKVDYQSSRYQGPNDELPFLYGFKFHKRCDRRWIHPSALMTDAPFS